MKICPDCQERYADDVDVCQNDGEELVDLPEELSGNPALPQPQSASPTDRTSMLDLEALEAKRAARQQQKEAEAAAEEEAGADDETPPPVEPLERDAEATGTLQQKNARKRREASRVAAAPREPTRRGEATSDSGGDVGDADAPEPARAEEPTGQTRARSTRTGLSRTGLSRANTNVGGGTRTGARRPERTRHGDEEEAPSAATRQRPVRDGASGGSRGVRVAALTVIALCLVVGGIIAVARNTAVLTVTTVPPGATVKLDGELLGISPIQKRLRTGSHLVELELDGFLPFKEVVDLPAGGLPYLQPLQKRPPPPPPPPTPAQIAADLAAHAKQLLDNGDLDAAKERADEAAKLDPTQAAVTEIGAAVAAALKKRDADRAAAAANAGREQQLRQARVLLAEGRQLYEKGRLGDAKGKLYQSLQHDAHNPEPHRVLSRIFNREDQVDKVRYHLQRYLELGGQDADFKVREWLKEHPP
ncbi:MAG: PEGA domain-containing protein [Deltaproteobacteria bacterium]|nr:PEGA domain-containing protein [Deltaproteobacteria bacterium]